MSEKQVRPKFNTKCKYNVCPEWVVDSLLLIHYGSNEYRPELFREIKNSNWVKPSGGLWTSPFRSEYGWVDWCRMQDFRTETLDKHFKVKFRKGSKVLIIDSVHDLNQIPKNNYHLDFKLISNKFDAIWLTVNGQSETRFSEPYSLYGWDCESILVMNKKSIEPIQ